MVLIIGGAYQGKLDYAKATYGLEESEIFTCTGQTCEIDFSKKCIDHIECFVLACVQSGTDAQAYFQAHAADWAGSILICQDISGGVVPMGAELRAWRQRCGRLCQMLSERADRVSRIFCGLEQRLK